MPAIPTRARTPRAVQPPLVSQAVAAAPGRAFGDAAQSVTNALVPLFQQTIAREQRRKLNQGEAALNDLYTEMQSEGLQRNDYEVYSTELPERFGQGAQAYIEGVDDGDVQEALRELANRSQNSLSLHLTNQAFRQSEEASLVTLGETVQSDIRRFIAQPLSESLGFLADPSGPGGESVKAMQRRIQLEAESGNLADATKMKATAMNDLAVEFANRLVNGMQAGEIGVAEAQAQLENRGHPLLSRLSEGQRGAALRSLEAERNAMETGRKQAIAAATDATKQELTARIFDPDQNGGVPTIGEVMAAPFLDAGDKEHYAKLIETRASGPVVEIPSVVASTLEGIQSGEITSNEQITALYGHGLTYERVQSLMTDLKDVQAPQRALYNAQRKTMFKSAHEQFRSKPWSDMDPEGEAAYERYASELTGRLAAGLAAKIPESQLLDPFNENYVARDIQRWIPTQDEVTARVTQSFQAEDPNADPVPESTIPPRKPTETWAEYQKRTGVEQ